LLEDGLIVPRAVGEFLEQGDHLRVEVSSEQGQKFQADFVSAKPDVLVARVNSKVESAILEFPLDFLSRQGEKRPHHITLEDRVDSAQTSRSRAAQKLEEDGFCLIGGRMRGRDLIQPSGIDERKEELIAKLASRGLEVPMALARDFRDLGFFPKEFEAVRFSQTADKSLVGVGLGAAQVMVEVDNRERQAQVPFEVPHEFEQQHRVRPPRDAHTNALAGAK
jgi:hypothetical protein